MNERYRQVKRLEGQHPVKGICQLLAVSRSGFYDWRGRSPSRRQEVDAQICGKLKAIFEQSRRTYGRPRLTHILRTQEGMRHGNNRISRLMRLIGLRARSRRRYRPQTTQSRHEGPIAPNRLAQRQGTASCANQVWVNDMTYIETGEGWLFLSVVMDLYSRRVVGWAFHETLVTNGPLKAIQMALDHRRPQANLLHHSDRGCQYASTEYRGLLKENNIEPSMSRTGNPYDNAAMESFFSTLKTECLHQNKPATRSQARILLFDYIEVFYNRVRIHSALGYQSPVDFETKLN